MPKGAERRAATQLCAQLPPRPSEVRLSHRSIVCRGQGYLGPAVQSIWHGVHVFTTRPQIICPAEAESENQLQDWVAAAKP